MATVRNPNTYLHACTRIIRTHAHAHARLPARTFIGQEPPEVSCFSGGSLIIASLSGPFSIVAGALSGGFSD